MIPSEPVVNEAAVVEEYLELAHKQARWAVYRSGGSIDESDALSGALLGLLRAVRTYDPTRGVTLRSYATLMIRLTITDSLRELGIHRAAWRRGNRPPCQLYSTDSDTISNTTPFDDGGLENREEVDALLRRIPSIRLQRVFSMYHLEYMTLKQIGREIGISEARVGHLLTRAGKILTGGRRLDLQKGRNGITFKRKQVT